MRDADTRREVAQVDRITTVLELLELVRDERVDVGGKDAMPVDAPVARRKSMGGKGAADWPALIVPLFNLLATLQSPSNAGMFRGDGGADRIQGGPRVFSLSRCI